MSLLTPQYITSPHHPILYRIEWVLLVERGSLRYNDLNQTSKGLVPRICLIPLPKRLVQIILRCITLWPSAQTPIQLPSNVSCIFVTITLYGYFNIVASNLKKYNHYTFFNHFNVDMGNASAITAGGTNTQQQGLRILICGAGIGGLSAAIGLRQQGHEVLVSTTLNTWEWLTYGMQLCRFLSSLSLLMNWVLHSISLQMRTASWSDSASTQTLSGQTPCVK